MCTCTGGSRGGVIAQGRMCSLTIECVLLHAQVVAEEALMGTATAQQGLDTLNSIRAWIKRKVECVLLL